MKDAIKEGDSVCVSFGNPNIRYFYGIVRHVPVATGDSWIIECDYGNRETLHYISCGCIVSRNTIKDGKMQI